MTGRWLLLLWLCALAACSAEPAGSPVITLGAAQAELQPEGQPAQHKPVTLRHRWDKDYPGLAGRATYRLELPPSGPPAPRALWFSYVGNQAQVRINGVDVQRFGELGNPRLDAGKAGQKVVVPPALLHRDGPNTLEIEATMQPLRAGGLAEVRYGPAAEIDALYERQRLGEQSSSAAYTAALLLMGGLAAGLWWRQRDALYGCFSAAAFFGVARHLDRVWLDVPVPWPLWGALLAIAYGCHLGLIARFVLLLVGVNPPRLVRAIHGVLVAVVALAALSFWWLVPGLWTAALGLLELTGLACLVVVVREAVLRHSRIAWLLLGTGGLLLLAGLHDIVLVRMALFGGSSVALTSHALFFQVLILAGLVVGRFNRSVAEHRALNDHLAERVAERERQLHDAFETLRVQRHEQAVLSERQRIMREIHDGIGSQLVGLLSMVGQPQLNRQAIEEHVRGALDEMRMAVDSLQPAHSDLTTVLATLRYRLQPRLQAAGIEVVWEVSALPPISQLSPQAIFQVQRILLEAFTNVLKHARASRVTVQAEWRDGDRPEVVLRLSDNGAGLRPGGPTDAARGQGVSNMQARAAAIGAALTITSLPAGGACVELVWPIQSTQGEDP
ncbi:sensor histidine kinase [Sphaerotilaceae bacterium SBD11-9]